MSVIIEIYDLTEFYKLWRARSKIFLRTRIDMEGIVCKKCNTTLVERIAEKNNNLLEIGNPIICPTCGIEYTRIDHTRIRVRQKG